MSLVYLPFIQDYHVGFITNITFLNDDITKIPSNMTNSKGYKIIYFSDSLFSHVYVSCCAPTSLKLLPPNHNCHLIWYVFVYY